MFPQYFLLSCHHPPFPPGGGCSFPGSYPCPLQEGKGKLLKPSLASTAQVKPKLIPTTDLFVHSWNITEYLPCAGPQHLHLRV